MSDPFSAVTPFIDALQKLINSWALGITLTLAVGLFVFGERVEWLHGIPQFARFAGAMGIASLMFQVMRGLRQVLSAALRWCAFQLKQHDLTEEQNAILRYCVSRDEPWIQIAALGDQYPLDDPFQRFLESDLAYLEVNKIRFKREYWKWINHRRRKILAKKNSSAADDYLRSILERSANSLTWMEG